MVWNCTSCSLENDDDSAQRCDVCGEPRITKTQEKATQPWNCSNCSCENEPNAQRCDVCGEPRATLSSEGKHVEVDEEDDYKDPDAAFDDVVSFAAQNKKKILQFGLDAQAKYPNAIGIVDEATGSLVIRARVSVDFIEPYLAHIWGLDEKIPLIIDFNFNLEDYNRPPHFNLYQSGDTDLNRNKMKDVSSFGLEWQLRARMGDWLNGDKNKKDSKSNWPPAANEDWFGNCIEHIKQRVKNCIATCIICDGPLPCEMIKPSVCSKTLCVHSHESYGLGADVASEIRERSDVVDMLVTLAYASSFGDIKRFNPYPFGVEVRTRDEKSRELVLNFLKPEDANATKTLTAERLKKIRQKMGIDFETPRNEEERKKLRRFNEMVDLYDYNDKLQERADPKKLHGVWPKLPSIQELKQFQDTKSIKAYLDTIDPLCFPLLRWCITSNRAHLARLAPEDQIPEMKTDYQYMFLSSPPEKEAVFQKLKKEKGSFWAFHGSGLSNWHCILRVGLKNFSGTDFMTTGAAYGSGIYMSPSSSTSAGYGRGSNGWAKSEFAANGGSANSIMCLAICEVINDGYKANPHYVVPNEDHVITRYFFIYNGKFSCPSVQADQLKPKNPLDKKN